MNEQGEFCMKRHIMQNQVVNYAINYIISHATEDLKVDDIAQVCGYSKYYLERLFKAETGESIYSYIKRLKVEQSAFRLKVEKESSVTEMGEEYGYSASNYATLFKNHFGRTPANFRRQIREELKHNDFFHEPEKDLLDFEECSRNITVEEKEEYFVLYERRKGDYHNLSENWCDFIDRYREFITPDTLFLDVTYDDPSIVTVENCLYDVCMTVNRDDPRLKLQKTAAVGITSRTRSETLPNTMVIPGGKFAVYHYKGYPQLIYKAYQSVFSNWLSETGNRIDNRIGYDIYRRIDEDCYMEMDICIPIR